MTHLWQPFPDFKPSAARHPAAFDRAGCSKTTLARAAAAGSRATLLPLSCAQLFSMYAGEGEALLRDTFMRARLAAPSIVFLDEVDAVAGEHPRSRAAAFCVKEDGAHQGRSSL